MKGKVYFSFLKLPIKITKSQINNKQRMIKNSKNFIFLLKKFSFFIDHSFKVQLLTKKDTKQYCHKVQSFAKLDKHNLYFVQIDVNAHDKMLMGHIDNREYNITQSYVKLGY